MKTTNVFSKNIKAYNEGYRVIVNRGGTRSGKTFAILQLIYCIHYYRENQLTSIVSESFPHLSRGAITDFKNILMWDNIFDYDKWNQTHHKYSIDEHSVMEFFALDNAGKAHGSARDNLFINEGQNMHYEIVRQLMQRTSGTVFIDYNPTHDSWIEDKILTRSDAILIHSTYKDNNLLPESIVKEIEQNRGDEYWWRVYGEGLLGKREGLIYDFEIVDEIPQGADLSYGLDFGFNHPAAVMKVGMFNNAIYIDEMLYGSGLITGDLTKFCKENINGIIYADGSRPESIEEMARAGVRILPAIKGQGSVLSQISFVKKHKIYVTKRSLNTIKELRNYRWLRDKNDNSLDEPVKVMDDAMDAFRYGVVGKWFREFRGAKFKF